MHDFLQWYCLSLSAQQAVHHGGVLGRSLITWNKELLKGSPRFQPGVGQNIVLCASTTTARAFASDFCVPGSFNFILPQPSPDVKWQCCVLNCESDFRLWFGGLCVVPDLTFCGWPGVTNHVSHWLTSYANQNTHCVSVVAWGCSSGCGLEVSGGDWNVWGWAGWVYHDVQALPHLDTLALRTICSGAWTSQLCDAYFLPGTHQHIQDSAWQEEKVRQFVLIYFCGVESFVVVVEICSNLFLHTLYRLMSPLSVTSS